VTSTNKIRAGDIAQARLLYPRAFGRPFLQRALIALAWCGVVALLGYTLVIFDMTPQRIVHGLGKLGFVLGFMFPPYLYDSLQAWTEPLYAIAETVAMAFMGTMLASIAALFLGFLGARNVVRWYPAHFMVRRGFDFLRAIETIILALIFIRAFGLGPLAGIFAIAVSDTGSLSKLFAEAIENVDRKPIEGLKASGANLFQVMRLAIVPQVLPIMISNALYYLESNTRTATILGIVGAGGIGFLLDERIRANNWDEVMTIVMLLLVTVAALDKLSTCIRRKMIGDKDVA